MPQEIRVLQCFECKVFQVDIVKKAKKWACKMCGVTQSLRKEFFRGSGPDARIKAQQLNMTKGNQEKEETKNAIELLQDENFDWDVLEKAEELATVSLTQQQFENSSSAPVPIDEKWGTGKRKYANDYKDHTKKNKVSKWAEFS